jgi:hypothetical protein
MSSRTSSLLEIHLSDPRANVRHQRPDVDFLPHSQPESKHAGVSILS